MQVTETRVGYSAPQLNARDVIGLKLLPADQVLELLTPEELPVSGCLHTVNKNGLSVCSGTALTEITFPAGGCRMEETNQADGAGKFYDLELSLDIPRNNSSLLGFLEANSGRQWVAIWKDRNGFAYIGGERENGLRMTIGRSIGSANVVNVTLRSRSWHSVYFLETFDSASLLPDLDFSLEFDLSFNA